jgi:hypothetical protein
MRTRKILITGALLAGTLLPAMAFGQDAVETDSGTTSWMLVSTALVLLMVPCPGHNDACLCGNRHHGGFMDDFRIQHVLRP